MYPIQRDKIARPLIGQTHSMALLHRLPKGLYRLPVALMLFLAMGCQNASSEFSKVPTDKQVQLTASTQSPNPQPYAQILKTYVNPQGLVNYTALQNQRQPLDTFNQALAAVPITTYQAWSESEKIAFLLNTYNTLTLASIIDQQPIKASIRDIPGVWQGRRFSVAGQSLTLDEIEHKILRQQFQEPRIHVALVCAAQSCPPLRQEPYQANRLDQQLDDQVRRFLASPHGFKLDRKDSKVYLSKIFEWFGEDWQSQYAVEQGFTGSQKERAVLNFIASYLNPEDRAYLEQGNYKIQYLDYDWRLNRQE
jgi:hypothetical protein